MVKTRGSQNRVSLLRELSIPKDRFQLAKATGLDWKTVDYHTRLLLSQGIIEERVAYGNVKLYGLTPVGLTILRTLDEVKKNGTTAETTPGPFISDE